MLFNRELFSRKGAKAQRRKRVSCCISFASLRLCGRRFLICTRSILLLCCLPSKMTVAQQTSGYQVARVMTHLKIDGRLDERAWADTEVAELAWSPTLQNDFHVLPRLGEIVFTDQRVPK